MEVSYRRDLNHNYMILENERITGQEYMVRMMEQNQIPELLKFQVRRMNGKTYLYYEITSRQPMSRIYEMRGMKSREIRQLLEGIRDGLNRCHQYLLDGRDILLEPEYIYMDVDTRQIRLCYVPYSGEEGGNSFLPLSEYILKHLDHGEQEAVNLGYELYNQAARDNFSLSELLRQLLQEQATRTQQGKAGEGIRNGQDERAEAEQEDRRQQEGNRGGRERNGRERSGQEQSGRERNGRERNSRERSGQEQSRRERNRQENRKQNAWEQKGPELSGQSIQERKRGKRKKRGLAAGGIALAAAMLIFGITVYFAGLDLTQAGGLGFLLLAAVWIVYEAVSGKGKKAERWPEDEWEEDDDEEAFLEALMAEAGEEAPFLAQKGEADIRQERQEGGERTEEGRTGTRRREIGSGEEEETWEEELGGETRCLTEAETGKGFRLVSLEADKYGDLSLDKKRLLVGKKQDQADLWLKDPSVSRVHARIEQDGAQCFVTDLNSMNGTFVNGERLLPNEKRELVQGDRVSFAARHYRMKVREF